MKLMPAFASVAASRESRQLHYALLARSQSCSIRPDANKTYAFIYAHMHANTHTHTHIVYSASSLPDAVANKYLLHYTHLTNRKLRCALMEYNKYKAQRRNAHMHTDSSARCLGN